MGYTKEFIVLHHSATPDGTVLRDFDAIKAEHLRRGYRTIGYTYVIEKVNGALVVQKGRGEDEENAACPGRNRDGIHICCVGNFQTETPSDELYATVARLCNQIITRHPIKQIGGHRDYYATACPGKNFNVDRVKALMRGGIPVNIEKALVVLLGAGVLSDVAYWKAAAESGKVQYLDKLLVNMAEYCEKHKN